ncbi:biotin transporter BioY [Alphaproteobacteria bacterium 46_93_T64]|nr:biotin transporter BioY [Alphaproteobacteria bacterium 46_93_T64]
MNTKDIVYIALFAALMAGLGFVPAITIPSIGVPVTAQSLGIMLAGGILGAKRGALSIVLFLVLVAVGLPLLAGGRGGLGVFSGASGGFLLGWIAAAYAVGYIVEKYWNKLNIISAAGACILGGVVLLYAIGIPWVTVAASIPFMKALMGSLAFIPGDLIKAVFASAVIVAVKNQYPLISK